MAANFNRRRIVLTKVVKSYESLVIHTKTGLAPARFDTLAERELGWEISL